MLDCGCDPSRAVPGRRAPSQDRTDAATCCCFIVSIARPDGRARIINHSLRCGSLMLQSGLKLPTSSLKSAPPPREGILMMRTSSKGPERNSHKSNDFFLSFFLSFFPSYHFISFHYFASSLMRRPQICATRENQFISRKCPALTLLCLCCVSNWQTKHFGTSCASAGGRRRKSSFGPAMIHRGGKWPAGAALHARVHPARTSSREIRLCWPFNRGALTSTCSVAGACVFYWPIKEKCSPRGDLS